MESLTFCEFWLWNCGIMIMKSVEYQYPEGFQYQYSSIFVQILVIYKYIYRYIYK